MYLFCPCTCRFTCCYSCHFGQMPVLFVTQPKFRIVASSNCRSDGLLVPGFHKHISCISLNSNSFPLFHSLCLGEPVFIRIHPCFSRQSSFNNRSNSFSTFVVMCFDGSSMRCQCCTTQTTSCVTVSPDVTRQHVESSWLSLRNSFHRNPSQWRSRSFSVSCDFLCPLQFRSQPFATACHPSRPSSSRPCIAQCLSRPTFASHTSVLGNARNCFCSIIMIDKDSLSRAACKGTDTVFPNFTEPNFLSKLRHELSPSSSSSSQFLRLCIFTDSHVVLDLCCKNGKSQRSSGLSSAMRTPVFCSAEIGRVLHALSFYFSHSHFHTTIGHVISFQWSLWIHFNSCTRLNHRILK